MFGGLDSLLVICKANVSRIREQYRLFFSSSWCSCKVGLASDEWFTQIVAKSIIGVDKIILKI